jgi:hypothetical protein
LHTNVLKLCITQKKLVITGRCKVSAGRGENALKGSFVELQISSGSTEWLSGGILFKIQLIGHLLECQIMFCNNAKISGGHLHKWKKDSCAAETAAGSGRDSQRGEPGGYGAEIKDAKKGLRLLS